MIEPELVYHAIGDVIVDQAVSLQQIFRTAGDTTLMLAWLKQCLGDITSITMPPSLDKRKWPCVRPW